MTARQMLLTLALCGTASLAGAQPAGVQARSAVSDAPPRNNVSAQVTPDSISGGSGVSTGGSSATSRRVVAVPGGDPSYGGGPGYGDPGYSGGGEYYPGPPAPFYPIQPEIWTAKDAYAINESIEFFFSVNRDAYVYIFNTDAAGITSQIFPNYWDQSNYIRAGRVYKIPTYSPDNYHFRIAEPAGSESVTIMATADRYQPVTVYHTSFSSHDPYPTRIPSPFDVLAQMDISWRGSFGGGGHRGGGHGEMTVDASFSMGGSFGGRSGEVQGRSGSADGGVSYSGGVQGRRVVAVPGGDPGYAPPPPPPGPSYEFGASTLHFTTYRAGFPHPYPQPPTYGAPVPVPPSPPYHRPNPPTPPNPWRDRPTPPWRR
jgi:hypothetical protein